MKTFSTSKILYSILVFFLSANLFAQDFQGQAHYFSKTTVDMDGWGGREMSPEMKAQIAERMRSMFEKTFVLTFNREESMYKEDEALDTPGGRGGAWRGMMSSFTGGPQYKNVKDVEIIQEQEFFGKQFLVKDALPQLEWKMGSETKIIGQYTCFKATAMKPVDELDWTNMRRRNQEDEEKKEAETDTTATASTDDDPMNEVEVPEEVEVVAWYTPQIPVNQGPGEYWGLPGLILEVNSGRTTILCSKIILNPEEKKEIKKPSKGKEVTRQEYNETVKQKMKEMREMYGGRRGGGRRGGN